MNSGFATLPQPVLVPCLTRSRVWSRPRMSPRRQPGRPPERRLFERDLPTTYPVILPSLIGEIAATRSGSLVPVLNWHNLR